MVDVWKELGRALGRALKPLADMGAAIWTAFGDAAGDLVKGFMAAAEDLKTAVEPTVTDLMPSVFEEAAAALGEGSPPKEVKEAVDRFVKQLMEMVEKEAKTEGKSLPSMTDLLARQAALTGGIIGMYALTHAISIALDATQPLKDWGFKTAIMDMLYQFNSRQIIGPMIQAPIWSSVITPMRMRANEAYPYQVPGTGVLPYLRAKDIIAGDEYTRTMKYHALDEDWSGAMLENTARYPDWGDLRVMVHRGVKTWDEARQALKMSLIQAEWLDAYEEVIPSIPGVSDLVRFAVREAYPDATTFEEHYARMTEWIGHIGYDRYFADAFWTAHWIIPTTGQADALLHRGDIDVEEHRALYILNDIRPEDVDRLRGLTWSLPGRIDARWMFRWGEIDVSGLRDLLVKEGLSPEYADRVASATAKNQFLTDINRQIANAKADYARGYSVESTLRKDLSVLGLRSEMVEYHVQDAIADRERDIRDEELRTLRSQYARGAITMAQVLERAEEILVDGEARRAWVEALPSAKQVMVVEETFTTEVNRLVANAKYDYVRGYTLKEALVSRLQLLDLPPEVIEFHVMDADEDRERQVKDRTLDIYEDAWLKDEITDWTLIVKMATPILVDEEARALWLDELWLSKMKTRRE